LFSIELHAFRTLVNVKQICFVTAPASFDVVLRLVRPAMSKQTQTALIIFGYNEDDWSDYVLNLIPAHQIEKQFGGNKIEN